MESKDSEIPSDRQSGQDSKQKPLQDESDAKNANEENATSPAVASSGSVKPTTKDDSSSKKNRREKKSKDSNIKPASEQAGADGSSSSSGDAASDFDGEEPSTAATRSLKKRVEMKNKDKKKARTRKPSSTKEKLAKKPTQKRKNKDKIPDTSSNSDSNTDTDDDSISSDSESSSDDSNSKSDKKTSKNNLKNQFKALQLQFTQLQYQLAGSSNYASYGAAANPYSLQQAAYPVTSQGAAAVTSAAVGRSLYYPQRGRPLPPGLQGTGLEDNATNDESSDDAKKKKKASKEKNFKNLAFKRVDQVWDSNIHNYKLQDTADMGNDGQYENFIFHVRRTFDWEGKYRTTIVDIKSKLLRECLQDVIGNVEGISLVDEVPKISPNLLFLYLEDMRNHLKALRKAKPAGETKKARKKNQERLKYKRKHLKVLIKYLDHDYERTKESLYPMLESGLITFDLLWALWKPNTLAYTTTYGSTQEPRVFKVEMAQLHRSIMKGEFYYVDGKYFEFDGKRFGYGNMAVEMEEFQGAKKITSLSCYPLQYHQKEEKLRRDLIERGKKFVSLSGVHYKSYQGIAFLKRKKGQVMKFNIQPSRVMIDPTIFRRINPNYSVSTVKPKHPDILSDEEDSDSDSDNCCGCSDAEDGEKVKWFTKVYKDSDGEVRMVKFPRSEIEDEPEAELDKLPSKKDDGEDESEGSGKDDEKNDVPEFTDEEYLIASPVVLGFAFSEKQWLELAVSGASDIKWNEKAWDSLVLEDGTKDLIKALVKSRKYHAANTIDDVIQGKGKGLVTVLHGPPGTGKTLTAEGIGELLQCPLYMASAGELGTDSRFLEAELQKILDICHAWGAILLLDEADVFLEKRNMHDIHRNALVSIFLRQLEYFQGILFLTTNRVETFDEAFQSRIHIALRYDNLDSKAKRTIFKMFLDRVQKLGKLKVEPLTEEDLTALSKQDLNGREIKNVVGSAQDLAVNKGEALSIRHIKQVLDVHAKFGQDLKGGTGYEDAMRSYF
ncbi:hypothetical protein FVEN_g621 [Fusarium venenatum]|uniref:AAA+ ATPase domain-containing protein n=1 Tax=Fusarium venenatum TaxID=56646 RepID=A0A2L2SXX2_9HYPO|nr:uncharacterized protein FVRRES_07240 [Fusarium venenatum]KAG8361981.1 hypothetical protein FVEN_g621 [Fusarium venenatum]CEI62804.1 unnamed protein product [Fusarium venenatum]